MGDISDPWEDDPDEIDRLAREGFRHEVECYGVADGWQRKPLDPAYVDWPEYVRGHATGMKVPADTAPRD